MNSQLTGLLTSLAGRYAKSLYDLALEQNTISKIAEHFKDFLTFLEDHGEVKSVLLSPSVTQTEKLDLFTEFCSRLNLDSLMIQFFHVLIENRRLAHLWDIQMIYQKIVDAEENKQMAHVVSAYPLTAEQQNQIATLLKRQTSGVLTLTFSTDPTVLGGFSVRNSNTVIDLTFANQLKSLMHTMKGTA